MWGKTSRTGKTPDPVRVESAWEALVSRELFEQVPQALRSRAPSIQRPARVGSRFLLSGLLRCGLCGKPYVGQGAKSGRYGYYVCATLHREGAGACGARYLNAERAEGFVVEKIRERILTDETITELVTLVAEEIDALAGELGGKLQAIEAELGDVQGRLLRLYEALEQSDLTLEALSPRILSLRQREDQLAAAREDAARQLAQRKVELPTSEEIKAYVAGFRSFLEEGTFPERKALIRNFVQGIKVSGDEAEPTYTIPMPAGGVTSERAAVLDFVQSGPLRVVRARCGGSDGLDRMLRLLPARRLGAIVLRTGDARLAAALRRLRGRAVEPADRAALSGRQRVPRADRQPGARPRRNRPLPPAARAGAGPSLCRRAAALRGGGAAAGERQS